MNYCTRCGRKLPASRECPYCSSRYYGRRSQPMIRAVADACSSYVSLALACLWSVSILCLLVFSTLTLNPLALVAFPGAFLVVGLWMLYGGAGRTRRRGLTLVSGALCAMSVITAIALTVLCLLCFGSIFLCTSYQNYDTISTPLLFLAVGLLLALPLTLIFLHKLRRIATTSRSVLLRSRKTVEVSIYAIAIFLVGAFFLGWCAFQASGADQFLLALRTMVEDVLPALFALIFTYLTGISWVGMRIPLLLCAVTSLYSAVAFICYRVRLYQAKKSIPSIKAEKEAVQADLMPETEEISEIS